MDGSTRSTHLKKATSFREAPEMNLFFPIEGVVIEAIPPTDERNNTKRGWEYTVAPKLEGIPYLEHVPAAMGFGYYGDGNEEVLQAAKRTADPANNGAVGKETQVSYEETDGDRVLVHFIQGVWTKPIIVARLGHQQNTVLSTTPALENAPTRMKATPEGRTRRTTVINGTLFDVDQDGNVTIVPGTPVDKDLTSKEKKKISIMKADGTTNVMELTFASGTWAINYGVGADQKMVLGDALTSYLNNLVSSINAELTKISVWGAQVNVLFGVAGPITGTPPATPYSKSDAPSPTDAILSNWIKSKKAAP